MTLEEAIDYCYKTANSLKSNHIKDYKCSNQYIQLAHWLEELKDRRKKCKMKKQLTQEQIVKELEEAGVKLTKNFDLSQPNCSYPLGKDKRVLTINGLKKGK